MARKRPDLVGMRFGSWEVIQLHVPETPRRLVYWLCRCECGTERLQPTQSLVNRGTKSCGCQNRRTKAKVHRGPWSELRRSRLKPRPKCPICESVFVPRTNASKSGRQRYCSRQCAQYAKAPDLTGATFGDLTAIRVAGSRWPKSKRQLYWLCRCNCGNESIVATEALTTGHSQSCGCRKWRHLHGAK